MKANYANHQDAWEDPRYYCGVNEYLKAQMPGKSKEECITIWGHVENWDDKIFWDKITDKYKPKYNFEINPHKYRGCGHLINLATTNKLNACRIIFIDSDYRYLLDDEILKNKYVFHTYSHSIENHFCYSKNLKCYCDKVSRFYFNQNCSFDFDSFFNEYSQIIFDSFLCAVCKCCRMNNCNQFQVKGRQEYLYFSSIITELQKEYQDKVNEIKNSSKNKKKNEKWTEIRCFLRNFEKNLKTTLIDKYKRTFNKITLCETCDQHKKDATNNELHSKGITNSNIYIFIHGKKLYNNGVKQLLILILKILITRMHCQNYDEPIDQRKHFNSHFHRRNSLDKIFENINCDCDLVDNIKDDIKNFINDPINQKGYQLKAGHFRTFLFLIIVKQHIHVGCIVCTMVVHTMHPT